MYYVAIASVIVGTLCYHISARSIDPRSSAAGSLVVTYALAVAIVSVIAAAGRRDSTAPLPWFAYVNLKTAGLAVGIVLIELGYVLAYRAGAEVSRTSVIATTMASLLLVPIGLTLFAERASALTIIGIFFALLGIGLIGAR